MFKQVIEPRDDILQNAPLNQIIKDLKVKLLQTIFIHILIDYAIK